MRSWDNGTPVASPGRDSYVESSPKRNRGSTQAEPPSEPVVMDVDRRGAESFENNITGEPCSQTMPVAQASASINRPSDQPARPTSPLSNVTEPKSQTPSTQEKSPKAIGTDELEEGSMIRTSLSGTLDSHHSRSSVVSGEWGPVYGPYHLTADQLRMLRGLGLLPNLPCVTTEEINGRSKAAFFSKTIAVIQIFFDAFQVTVRAIRGISISQLELAVTAFSLCAIVIYAFQWYRPKDIQVPLTIVKYRGPIPDEILQRLADYEDQNKLMSLAAGLGVSVRTQVYGSPVPNDTLWQECENISTSGMLLGSFLFGAIHISGWNFSFPTSIERNIWRAASLLTTTGPILTLLLAMMIAFFLEGMSWENLWQVL